MDAPAVKEREDADRVGTPVGVRTPAGIRDLGDVAGEALARIGAAAKAATTAIRIAEDARVLDAEHVLRSIEEPVACPPLTVVEDRTLTVHGTWCGWSNGFTRELLPVCRLRRVSASEWRFSVGPYDGFGGTWIEFRMANPREGRLVMTATKNVTTCRPQVFPPAPVKRGTVRLASGLRPDDEYLRGDFEIDDDYRGAFVVRNPFRAR
jgi:hypothetical protein